MSGLVRWLATAALRKLAGNNTPPMRALPAPSSTGLIVRPQQRQEPPLLHGTPVYRDELMPRAEAPPPVAAPPRKRRRKVVITEEFFSRRG
jgi:hypothetical protein